MSDTPITYLDYAATTPLCEEAARAMEPYVSTHGTESLEFRGNANSTYNLGRKAFSVVEDARREVAKCFGGIRPSEVVFTSGATESIFIALSGLFSANGCTHIITSALEHKAVIAAAKTIAGKNNVIELKPDKFGVISVEAIKRALSQTNKALVTLCHVNSEIGVVQDVAQLSTIVHDMGGLLHADITQSAGKMQIDLGELGVDAASFSSHKFCGPTGVGGLYISRNVNFASPIVGGGQENSRRGGTQNVAGIVGMAVALSSSLSHVDEEMERLAAFKAEILEALPSIKNDFGCCKQTVDEARAKDVHSTVSYMPNIVHITLPRIESETAIVRFDELGVCVSGGSACSSSSLEPSSVLREVGISDNEAICALRVSMGRYTNENDIKKFLECLSEVIL